jgi:hypothetical protein
VQGGVAAPLALRCTDRARGHPGALLVFVVLMGVAGTVTAKPPILLFQAAPASQARVAGRSAQ